MLLFSIDIRNEGFLTAGQFLLFVSAVLTLWSMVLYLRAALPVFSGGTARESVDNKELKH